MTDSQLNQLLHRLEAAKADAEERRQEWRKAEFDTAARHAANNSDIWLWKARAYAIAADQVETLAHEYEEAVADWQAGELEREATNCKHLNSDRGPSGGRFARIAEPQ